MYSLDSNCPSLLSSVSSQPEEAAEIHAYGLGKTTSPHYIDSVKNNGNKQMPNPW